MPYVTSVERLSHEAGRQEEGALILLHLTEPQIWPPERSRAGAGAGRRSGYSAVLVGASAHGDGSGGGLGGARGMSTEVIPGQCRFSGPEPAASAARVGP